MIIKSLFRIDVHNRKRLVHALGSRPSTSGLVLRNYSFVIKVLLITTVALSGSCLFAEALPRLLNNAVVRVDGELSSPLRQMRVVVMEVAQDVSIDPPPSSENFERVATWTLIIDASYYRSQMNALLQGIREAKWVKSEKSFYPRWCVRFIVPWNEVLAEFLIDTRAGAIRFGGEWYITDKKIIDAFTVGLKAKP